MGTSKPPSGEGKRRRTRQPEEPDAHDSPFATLPAPAPRRRRREGAGRATPTATPPDAAADAEPEVSGEPEPTDAIAPTQEPVATPDVPAAPPEPSAATQPPTVAAPRPGPRTYVDDLSDPTSRAYLEALNRIYTAGRPDEVRVISDEITAAHSADAGGAQAQGLRGVIVDVAKLTSETGDMTKVRELIDYRLIPLDRAAEKLAEAEAKRHAADASAAAAAVAPTPAVSSPPTPSRRSALTTPAGPSGIEGLPAVYDDGVQWLRNGFTRHQAGVWIGLVAGWTGIWIALWGAALGLIIGALAAAGLAASFGPIGIGQAASAVGIVVGGLLGAASGFAAVVRFLIIHSPIQAAISVASGAVLAILIVVAIAAFERLLLRARGYRRLSRAEVRRVAPLVKGAADAMNLPALPRFAMDDRLIANAWTHMRTVVLTAGLLLTLDDAELRAVLTHELEHWRAGDAVGLHFVWAAAWPVALVYNLGMLMAGRTQEGGQPRRGAILGFLALVGWVIAWPAWVIIKFVITPFVAASQRSYEYRADAAAASVGYGANLSSALRKMGAFEGGRTGWEQAMAATHPPTELRLEALEPPKPDDFEYQEADLRGPSGQEMSRLLSFWKRTKR